MKEDSKSGVRLDKWLWAARLFKTRGRAKEAIEGGKVHYEGARTKVSKKVEVGALLRVRQGREEKEIRVIGLSDQRRGAPEAALLYSETAESQHKREEAARRRQAERSSDLAGDGRPDKRDRRRLRALKARQQES